MSDLAPVSTNPVQPTAATDDRVLPIVVYVLYLVGLGTGGLTAVAGLIIAYLSREKATPLLASHYTFQIYTFWLSLAWLAGGVGLLIVGGVFSVILIGIPFAILGGLICALVGVWFAIRCIVGLVYIAQSQPYPRPRHWVI
jgi:uncharacterized membrane protein